MIEEKRQRILAQPMQVPARLLQFMESSRELQDSSANNDGTRRTTAARRALSAGNGNSNGTRAKDMLPRDLRQGKSLGRLTLAPMALAVPVCQGLENAHQLSLRPKVRFVTLTT